MTESTVPEGVEVRRFTRRDATVTEVFSVRVTDVDGTRRRRSFDSLEDALDYRAAAIRAALAPGGASSGAGRHPDAGRVLRAVVGRARDARARASDACGLSLPVGSTRRAASCPSADARDRRAPGRRLPRRVAGGGRRAHVGCQDDGDAPARLSRRRGVRRRGVQPVQGGAQALAGTVARRPSADAAAGRAARGRPRTRRQPPQRRASAAHGVRGCDRRRRSRCTGTPCGRRLCWSSSPTPTANSIA